MPVKWNRRGLDRTHIPLPAATIQGGVAVQNLPPGAAKGNANTVIVARHRCEVAYNRDDLISVSTSPQIADYAFIRIVRVYPFEACGGEILKKERWAAAIGAIQVLHPSLQT